MNTALLFSGQGSQYVGMMKDLYENFKLAQSTIDEADSILGYKLSDVCFSGPVDSLKETRYTQPALFLHSSVITLLIKDKINFNATAGHSVGEYAALFASGVLSFAEALNLVSLRGKLMFSAGEKIPGTMFAIIGLDDDVVVSICNELTETGQDSVVVPANFNSPGQVVVSGSADYLRSNADKFKQAGARMVTELVVSGAFHSPLVQSAKEELAEAIESASFSDAKVPVYGNVSAEPLFSAREIKESLIRQLTSPVLWTQSMNNMKRDGFSRFIEIGAGKVLQGLVKRTLKDVEILGIDKVDEVHKYISE